MAKEKGFDDIIIFDTETTGLDGPSATRVEYQPYITELYAARVILNDNNDLVLIDEFEGMFKPPVPISEEITKITGITQEAVDDKPPFVKSYDEIYELFHGCRYVVGHNVSFDVRMLKYELYRHDLEFKFNWPKEQVDTVEYSFHYHNRRLRLQQLHNYLFGHEFEEAHRAKNDVMATAKCFSEMVKRGDIVL